MLFTITPLLIALAIRTAALPITPRAVFEERDFDVGQAIQDHGKEIAIGAGGIALGAGAVALAPVVAPLLGLGAAADLGVVGVTELAANTEIGADLANGANTIFNAAKGTKNVADAVEGTKNIADAVEGTKNIADAAEGTKNVADAVEGTKDVTDAAKETEAVTDAVKGTGATPDAEVTPEPSSDVTPEPSSDVETNSKAPDTTEPAVKKNIFQSAADNTVGAVKDAGNAVKDTVGGAIKGVQNTVGGVQKAVGGAVEGTQNALVKGIDQVSDGAKFLVKQPIKALHAANSKLLPGFIAHDVVTKAVGAVTGKKESSASATKSKASNGAPKSQDELVS